MGVLQVLRGEVRCWQHDHQLLAHQCPGLVSWCSSYVCGTDSEALVKAHLLYHDLLHPYLGQVT